MNLLDFEQQSIPLGIKDPSNGGKYCTVLKLRGTIDITTHQQFEDALSELLEQNAKRLIINLAELKYISSSGTGLLIKYYKKYRDSGGDIKLSHIPPNIWKTLDLIGINSVLEVFNTDKDALGSFKDNERFKETTKQIFPAKFQCPSCKAVLEIARPAKYRCQYCNTYFAADKEGKVKAFLSRRPRVIEVKLSDSADNILWLESLVKSQSQWLGFPDKETRDLTEAINEVWKACSEKKKHPWHAFRVTLIMEGNSPDSPGSDKNNPTKMTVGITSFENLNISKTIMTNSSIRQKVTSIEVLPLLPAGELIKIIKTRPVHNSKEKSG
ncbi:MAG: STAS domain-containing protein [Planctomycetes bacterium]|nr:STAS domain-containing protein [Planctomycetota bacterium]